MRLVALGIASLVATIANGPAAHAQAPKGRDLGAIVESAPPVSYRTLTGKVGDIKPADRTLTIEVNPAPGEAKPKAKASGQSWLLSVGRQTLLLRAGRNDQYTTIGLAELKAGDTVQAVATLRADPADRSHIAWWLVVYPTGTTPPAR